ncbi:MAG: GTPase HflX [Salinispira sp.]
MIEYEKNPEERALLVCIRLREHSDHEVQSHVEELEGLCATIGFVCCEEKIVIPLRNVNPGYFIGKGWAEEIAAQAEFLEADYIVFDDNLSPRQQRNLEKLCTCPVIDRHQIIVEIFAQRAQTREAKLQVELAQLIYSLPRLRRMWTHLSRQQGGARGTRGEGETQLESDRRIVEARISRLKAELKQVRNQRSTLRKQRESIPIPTAAIVGYTNAGKSSLHRALTSSQVFVEDKLFATLDPTTRGLKLPSGQKILISDTVGFIRKLPHDLVDAFRSTLEETVLSKFLLHLVDASSPDFHQHITTTHSVLRDIGAVGRNEILIFNKCDRLSPDDLKRIRGDYPQAVYVSVKNTFGLNNLLERLELELRRELQRVQITLPHAYGNIIAIAHREGQVISTDYRDNNVILQAYLPNRILNSLHKKYSGALVEILSETFAEQNFLSET